MTNTTVLMFIRSSCRSTRFAVLVPLRLRCRPDLSSFFVVGELIMVVFVRFSFKLLFQEWNGVQNIK